MAEQGNGQSIPAKQTEHHSSSENKQENMAEQGNGQSHPAKQTEHHSSPEDTLEFHEHPLPRYEDKHTNPVSVGAEVQTLWKTFTLYCEKDKVSKVTLYFKSYPAFDKSLDPVPCSNNLWEANVAFHPKIPLPSTQYYYGLYEKGYFKFEKQSEWFRLRESRQNRDAFESMSVESVREHLTDILSDRQRKKSMKDRCMEIENLYLSNRNDIIAVINSVAGKLNQSRMPDSMVLFTAAFGSLCKQCYISPDSVYVQPHFAGAALGALQCYDISHLTTSSSSYMQDACCSLIKASVNVGECVIRLLNILFDFFRINDSLNILSMFDVDFQFVKLSDETQCQLFKLIENIFNAKNCNDKNVKNQSVSLLVERLPFDLIFRVLMDFKQSNCSAHEPIIAEIRKCLFRKIENVQSLVQTAGGISVIMFYWQTVYRSVDERKHFGSRVEETILNILNNNRRTIEGCEDDIKELVFQYELFQSQESQVCLLKALSEVKDDKINFLFIELASSTIFKDTYSSLGTTYFKKWYSASAQISSGTRKPTLEQVCSRLSLLMKLPICRERQDLTESIRDVTEKELSDHKTQDLVNAVSTIDKIVEEFPLLRETIIAVISKGLKLPSDHPKVLSSFIDESTDKMTVNTRLEAEIVRMVIAKDGVLEDCVSDEDLFLDILQKNKVWLIILRGTGEQDIIDYVWSHSKCQRVKVCIKNIFTRMKEGDVGFCFLQKIQTTANEFVDIMSLEASKDEVEKVLQELVNGYEKENKTFDCVLEVLKVIQEKKICLPKNFSSLIQEIKRLKENFESGKILSSECQKAWFKLWHLDKSCIELDKVTSSNIFWNVLGQHEDAIVYQYRAVAVEERHGENKMIVEDQMDDQQLYYPAMYVKMVEEVGISIYTYTLDCLQTGTGISMTNVISIFGNGPDIEKEKKISEQFFWHPVSQSVWIALKQVYNVKDVSMKVDAMEGCLKALNVTLQTNEDLHFAFISFHHLLNKSFAECTFDHVKTGMSTIFSLVEKLSPMTTDIMISVAESSSLIMFLRETVNEDIRNLIDAVEDISEQHVRESTVSGLIEVKRYFEPVLKTDYTGRCFELFETLENQTVLLVRDSNLPGKIQDCADNFHNLKSLYNNVANRGEQTKEIVKNILERGSFRFEFNEGTSSLIVEAVYGKTNGESSTTTTSTLNNIVKDKSILVDLRSRALLLMNTERDDNQYDTNRLSREELQTFVEYVDQCLSLANIFVSLHSSGHVDYISIDKSIKPADLKRNIDDLNKLLSNWTDHLHMERNSCYLLNFLHGPNLHILYKYLEKRNELDEQSRLSCTESVETLLLFIHPDMTAAEVEENYKKEKKSWAAWNNETMLHCIGQALTKSYPKKSEKEEEQQIILRDATSDRIRTDKIFNVTDAVQNGIPLVAQLDEGSVYTVKTVLALYALSNKQSLPKPHQVLFCTRETTADELDLLVERCIGEKYFSDCQSLFCIANVEMLSSELQFLLVEILKNIRERSTDFLLAVVCRGSKHHQIIDELSEFVTAVTPASDNIVKHIFRSECPHVLTLTSDLPGQGKTNAIRKIAYMKKKAVKVLHISGSIRRLQLIRRLRSLRVKTFNLLHIEICDIDNPTELDTFIFELVTLRYVSCDKVSAGLCTKYVLIEIANTVHDKLRDSLQTAMLFKRKHIIWNDFNDFVVSREIHSPVQVVCKYLHFLKNGILDKKDLIISCSTYRPMQTNECRNLLRDYLGGPRDMSFPGVYTAIRVLADQLKKMSYSPFFQINRLQDMVGIDAQQTIKSSLVKAMIESSKEFASRSVYTCRSTQITTSELNADSHSETIHASEQSLVSSKRVEGMIRWEDSNHLMFVFHSQNIQTITPIYSDITKVPEYVKCLFETQMKRKLQDFRQMSQNKLLDILQKIARSTPERLPYSKLGEMAKTYALTPDNILKMVLIVLRIKAKVPVIIMGETGCGKTALLRYLASICDIPFDVMNIHAGVSEKSIIHEVTECSMKASSEGERWMFLDEINTSASIGLIGNIICHHRCVDKNLAPNLVIIGACNPYRLRSKQAITTSGLTGKWKNDDLSKLVYRVHPLPEAIVDYVWDFGSLSEKDETLYIKRMVSSVFDESSDFHMLFTDLLSESQSFVRHKEASDYVVSLRDVQRCKLLTIWFLKVLKDIKPEPKTPYSFDCQIEIRAIVLALAHCYHCRFSDKTIRHEYRGLICRKYLDERIDISVDKSSDYVKTIITEEQVDILSRMDVPEGTARNTALMENIFIILVCIFNKIPVFVVGKPGCSKSLAMQVLRSNLRGKDSKDDFFRKLPQLYCVSYQGSESSTSEGIIKCFQKAENYQLSNNPYDVLSVVILDEIGLAEVSRFNPLKVLHNLLESHKQITLNIAVVGLSNWALDASKMNRAVHLSRTDMDMEELYETAKAISASFFQNLPTVEKDTTAPFLRGFEQQELATVLLNDKMEIALHHIAESYSSYMKKLRLKNFHGLRDFYALVKHISRTCIKAENRIQGENEVFLANIVMNGLERNFVGLPDGIEDLYLTFSRNFPFETSFQNRTLDLIVDNVNDQIARHLMLITNGDSALGIVEQHLNSIGRTKKEVIFGSQFEDDLTDDYNYRILSKIILCMEEGVVLVLKDLENIYGSLYDMLNQNYTIIGKKKNCRIALGPYSNPFCHVADSFRCVVLMDESKVRTCDPPFLNRFEKQYLSFSDIVDEEQSKLIRQLDSWISGLLKIPNKNFNFTDLLPIYSKDLAASLVWKLKSANHSPVHIKDCQNALMMLLKPAAVIRLKCSESEEIREKAEEIKESFFQLPLHDGLNEYITFKLKNQSKADKKNGLLTIVFTNSNVHTKLQKCVSDKKLQIDRLGIFKSEKQLTQRINDFWFNASGLEILLLQCSAVDDEKHILLTKTIIEQCRTNFLSGKHDKSKHVFLIIHLDQSKGSSEITSQINFVSDWNMVMIDNLEHHDISLQKLCEMEPLDAIRSKTPLDACLSNELLWAFTRIKYGPLGRDIGSIIKVLKRMKETPEFLEVLGNAIWNTVSVMDTQEKDWQVNVACDIQALRNNATFIDALEQHIMRIIKVPLAKLIYNMELHGIIDCFFISNNKENRRHAWISIFQDTRFFSIEEIPDDTEQPECYVCNVDDLALHMPFSRTIFNLLESNKDQFLDDLYKIKARSGLEPGDELPSLVYEQLLKQHERFILLNISDSKQFFYQSWETDYIDDFCNILSFAMCPSMIQKKRKDYMKWVIEQKVSLCRDNPFKLLVSLHTTSWINASLFRAEMQLFGVCEKVLTNKDILDDIMRAELKVTLTREGEKERVHMINKPVQLPTAATSDKPINPEISASSLTVDISDESSHSHSTLVTNEYDAKSSSKLDEDSFRLITPGNQNEQDIAVQQSSEVINLCPEKALVYHLCKEMLPTKKTLDMHGGIKLWQRKINTMLVLAARVSNRIQTLHSLRVCNDVASNLIIPLDLQNVDFEKMGALLKQGYALDSYEVFESVFRIALHGLDNGSKDKTETRYTVLSSYLVRCIDYNAETTALGFLFDLLISGNISEDVILYLKAPLIKMFDINNMDFLSLIGIDQEQSDDIDESTSDGIKDGNESDSEMSNQYEIQLVFMDQLDNFLKTLSAHGKKDSAIIVLIIDILQTVFHDPIKHVVTKNLVSNQFMVLNNCRNIAHEEHFGIRYITAISYVKGFFCLAAQSLLVPDEAGDIWKAISELFEDGKDKALNTSLQIMFLKSFLSWTTICKLKLFLRGKEDMYEFLKSSAWSKNYEMYCFERNPLCLMTNRLHHKEFPHCKTDIAQCAFPFRKLKDISSGNESWLLTLYSFAGKVFYFPRICEPINDTKRTLAKSILKRYNEHAFKTADGMKFLIGENDFKVPMMNIGEKTSHQEYCMTTFFFTVYSILLARNSFIYDQKLPFFIACLLDPSAVNGCFLPGVSEVDDGNSAEHFKSVSAVRSCSCGYRRYINFSTPRGTFTCTSCLEKSTMKETALTLCTCGYRIVYHLNEQYHAQSHCCFCNKEQNIKQNAVLSCLCDSYTLSDTTKEYENENWCLFCMCGTGSHEDIQRKHEIKRKTRVSWKCTDQEYREMSIRGLHPVTVHISQMVLKGCLLGSMAFGFSNIKDIKELTDLKDLDTDGFLLWSEMQQHWLKIAAFLNINDNNLSLFLHSALNQLISKEIIFEPIASFTQSTTRRIFENQLDLLVVSHIKNSSKSITETLRRHDKLHDVREDSLEAVLFEADGVSTNEKELEVLQKLLRLSNFPTKDNFISEFHIQRENYPFLNLVLHYERCLTLPHHIFNITQWHMAVITRANYVMKKHDCLEMKVEDFIYYKQDSKDNEKVKKRFEKFEQSWNELMTLLQFHKIANKMEVIHTGSQMKDCVMYGKETTLYELLKMLVYFQNEFLDKSLQIASDCSALGFLLRQENVSAIPCVQITEANLHDLINFSFKWNGADGHDMLDRESICSLSYGCGNQITYNFSSIERAVAVRILAGKSYLKFQENSLPQLIFTDELFVNYASLIRDLKACHPQQPLTPDIDNGIRKRVQEDPRIVRQLLAHLGILMTLLKKTGTEEEGKPLVDYATEWQTILTHEFPRHLLPSPETCVKLCHIVALSELLEEVCSESAVDALDKEYRANLDSTIHKHILHISQKKTISRMLLKVIKLFSHRCLSTKTADPKQPINSYLSDHSFWPEGSRNESMVTFCGSSENIYSLLPDFIMVRHVYYVAKTMELEIKTQDNEAEQIQARVIESRSGKSIDDAKAKNRQRRAAKRVCDY